MRTKDSLRTKKLVLEKKKPKTGSFVLFERQELLIKEEENEFEHKHKHSIPFPCFILFFFDLDRTVSSIDCRVFAYKSPFYLIRSWFDLHTVGSCNYSSATPYAGYNLGTLNGSFVFFFISPFVVTWVKWSKLFAISCSQHPTQTTHHQSKHYLDECKEGFFGLVVKKNKRKLRVDFTTKSTGNCGYGIFPVLTSLSRNKHIILRFTTDAVNQQLFTDVQALNAFNEEQLEQFVTITLAFISQVNQWLFVLWVMFAFHRSMTRPTSWHPSPLRTESTWNRSPTPSEEWCNIDLITIKCQYSKHLGTFSPSLSRAILQPTSLKRSFCVFLPLFSIRLGFYERIVSILSSRFFHLSFSFAFLPLSICKR